MRILILTHGQYGFKGVPKIVEYAERLVTLGNSVTLVATSRRNRMRPEAFTRSGVRFLLAPSVLSGGFRQGGDPYDLVWRLGLLRRESFDVVHAVDSRPTVILPALATSRRVDCALVIEWSDLFGRGGTASERSGRLYASTLGHVETFFEEQFRRYADAAVVTTWLLAERLAALGYPKERIEVQRYGCDTRRYGRQIQADARRRVGVDPDATVLCYAGTLFGADLELLLGALRAVRRSEGGECIQTILIGDHKLAPEVTSRLGIRLTGRLDDFSMVHDYLSAADLCLIPMRVSLANLARWPSKVADYFNAGRPVVATKVSDFELLFRQHGLGFLAEDDTPEGFAAAIRQALGERTRWVQIGRSCRRFAETELDITRLAVVRMQTYNTAGKWHAAARQ